MASIGSVFLGDVQRHRVFSTSTPPGSPPATSLYNNVPSPPIADTLGPHNASVDDILEDGEGEDELEDDEEDEEDEASPVPLPAQAARINLSANTNTTLIDPALALELRLRWLEAIVLGVQGHQHHQHVHHAGPGSHRKLGSTLSTTSAGKAALLKHGETLAHLAEDVQRRLDAIVEANEGLKRFMALYNQHANLLTPASALTGMLADSRLSLPHDTPPEYANLTPEEFDALLIEMEPDIRAADRDMREIEMLEKKGVIGAGRLPEYEALQPRLEALIKAHQEDLELILTLESRVATIMKQNAMQVDALSELFVAWDDTLTEAESKASRLEREKAERLRLGLE